MAKHSFPLAVDKDDLLSLGIAVSIHHAAEGINLNLEHGCIIEPGGRIDEFVDMQIDLDRIATQTSGHAVDKGRALQARRLTLLIAFLSEILFGRELRPEQSQLELFDFLFEFVNALFERSDFLLLLLGLGQQTSGLLLGLAQRSFVHGSMTCGTRIVLVGHNHTLTGEGWNFKSILVLYHDQIIVTESYYGASSLRVEESHLITNFYQWSIFLRLNSYNIMYAAEDLKKPNAAVFSLRTWFFLCMPMLPYTFPEVIQSNFGSLRNTRIWKIRGEETSLPAAKRRRTRSLPITIEAGTVMG